MNNEPAFPITAGNQVFTTGMTLRDWFAGMALCGALANPNNRREVTFEEIARDMYTFADSMLAEREKPNDH